MFASEKKKQIHQNPFVYIHSSPLVNKTVFNVWKQEEEEGEEEH